MQPTPRKDSHAITHDGAIAVRSAGFPRCRAPHGTSSADVTAAPNTDYNAQYEQCKQVPGSDQARCHDTVGMRPPEIERRGLPDDRMASLQNGDRCDLLNGDARRDCQRSDKAA